MHIEFMRSPEREVPGVSAPGEVTSLTVWHCKFATLERLAIFTNLRALKIATYPDASLESIQGLKHLQWLSVVHMPKVSDLEPLTKLDKLVSLELATLPSWDASSKRQVVNSLHPIARMPRLQFLALFGVIPKDKSLAALEASSSLQTARVSGYPAKEMKRFYEASSLPSYHVPPFPDA